MGVGGTGGVIYPEADLWDWGRNCEKARGEAGQSWWIAVEVPGSAAQSWGWSVARLGESWGGAGHNWGEVAEEELSEGGDKGRVGRSRQGGSFGHWEPGSSWARPTQWPRPGSALLTSMTSALSLRCTRRHGLKWQPRVLSALSGPSEWTLGDTEDKLNAEASFAFCKLLRHPIPHTPSPSPGSTSRVLRGDLHIAFFVAGEKKNPHSVSCRPSELSCPKQSQLPCQLFPLFFHFSLRPSTLSVPPHLPPRVHLPSPFLSFTC